MYSSGDTKKVMNQKREEQEEGNKSNVNHGKEQCVSVCVCVCRSCNAHS